jgi:hypothetical protein
MEKLERMRLPELQARFHAVVGEGRAARTARF